MVPQHTGALAGSTCVDKHHTWSSPQRPNVYQEAAESCSGKPNRTWLASPTRVGTGHQGQQGVSSVHRTVDSVSRTGPYRFDRFLFQDSVFKAESTEDSRDHRQTNSAGGAKTCRNRSQCTGGTVQRSRRHGRGKGTNSRGSPGTSESGKVRTLRTGKERNPSVRSTRNWKNIPSKGDRRRVRAALRIRIRS